MGIVFSAGIRILGLAGVIWGLLLLPRLTQLGPLNRITAEILQHHSFAQPVLLAEADRISLSTKSRLCNPSELHNAVVLHLAILEGAIKSGDQTKAEPAYGGLHDMVEAALACTPSDAFAWLTLFWLDSSRRSISAANAQYLRLSYTLAPNEAWIALWRSKLAFSVFEQLPEDLAEDALNEFVRLVDTGRLYPEMATIFTQAGLSAKGRIVERLANADAIARSLFARTLYDMGSEIEIPNTRMPGLRSWER
jgi:hypothetical protein